MDLIASQGGYWGVVAVAFAALFWTLGRAGDRAFLAASTLAMLALRWPTIIVVDPFIDEAQMIAQAITAAHHPIPWRDFDPTTSGPLNTYALLLPRLLGFPISWVGSRVVATLLVAAVIVAFYDAIRRLYGRAFARLVSLVPIVLFGAAASTDLVQYASELLSVALLMVAVNGAVRLADTPRYLGSTAFATGLFCGAVPFAKLQAAPVAAWIAASAIAVICVHRGARDSTDRPLAAFLAGLLAPTVATLSVVALAGALGDFYVSYIAQAWASMSGSRLDIAVAFSVSEFRTFLTATGIAGGVVAGLFAGLLVTRGAVAAPAFGTLAQRAAPLFSLALLAVTVYAIEVPHRPYAHYVLLTLIPLLLAFTCLAGEMRRRYPRWSRAVTASVIVYVAGCTGTLLAHAYSTRDFSFLSRVRDGTGIRDDPVARRMAEIAPPGSTVAIWGYAPYLYVCSQKQMGTRDSISQFAILPGRYREYYRHRFLRDLVRNQPAVFVDAVAPGQFLSDRNADAHETFPDLVRQVTEWYDLVDDVRGVRIFARKDLHVAGRSR